MVRFVLKVVGAIHENRENENSDILLFSHETNVFEGVDLDQLMDVALCSAAAAAGVNSLSLMKSQEIQVVFSLFAENEHIRPTINFSAETIQKLAEAGASFDFDPYVY